MSLLDDWWQPHCARCLRAAPWPVRTCWLCDLDVLRDARKRLLRVLAQRRDDSAHARAESEE